MSKLKKNSGLHTSHVHFVMNAPIYASSADHIDKTDSSDEEYDSDFSTYVTTTGINRYSTKRAPGSKKKPTGSLPEGVEELTETTNKDHISSGTLQGFVNTVERSAVSRGDVQDIVSCSVLLNRPKSLSTRANNKLYQEFSADTKSAIHLRSAAVFWKIKWYDSLTKKEASYEEVHSFYKRLKAYDKKHDTDHAEKFISTNEDRVQVPYQDLREYTKNHPHTKELIDLAREHNLKSKVYLYVTDGDTRSFNGVCTYYTEYVRKQLSVPDVVSTGYIVEQEQEGDTPIVKAVELDRHVRLATAAVVPGGVYYAEPNLCVLVPEGSPTVPESFKGRNTQKAESAVLISNVSSAREDATIHYADGPPVVTTIPHRMRTILKDRDGRDKFSTDCIAGGTPTYKDMYLMERLSQTNLLLLNWIKNLDINKFFKFEVSNRGKLNGALHKYLLGSELNEKQQEIIDAINPDDIGLIQKAYKARECAIEEYRQKHTQPPTLDSVREIELMCKHNTMAVRQSYRFGELFLQCVAAANIKDLLESKILLSDLHVLSYASLKAIIYNNGLMSALRNEEADFHSCKRVYNLYGDNNDEGLEAEEWEALDTESLARAVFIHDDLVHALKDFDLDAVMICDEFQGCNWDREKLGALYTLFQRLESGLSGTEYHGQIIAILENREHLSEDLESALQLYDDYVNNSGYQGDLIELIQAFQNYDDALSYWLDLGMDINEAVGNRLCNDAITLIIEENIMHAYGLKQLPLTKEALDVLLKYDVEYINHSIQHSREVIQEMLPHMSTQNKDSAKQVISAQNFSEGIDVEMASILQEHCYQETGHRHTIGEVMDYMGYDNYLGIL